MDTISPIVCQISFGSPESGQSNQQPTGTYSFLLGSLTYSGCSGVDNQIGSALSGLLSIVTGGLGS